MWTVDQVTTLLWRNVPEWCEVVGAEVPDRRRLVATMDTYLRHLSAHRLIARGSDPLASLRRAITDPSGTTSRRHPSLGQGRSPVVLAPVVPIA